MTLPPHPLATRSVTRCARSRLPAAFAAVVAVAIATTALPLHAATPGEVPIGGALREAQLRGLNGPARTLSSFRGQPLLVNVWASWCGPCRAEMASLERLAWLEPKPPYPTAFRIIGISTDDDRGQALRLLQASNATISHYIDRDLELENLLGANRLPLTVLVDARGQVLARVYGAREWDSPASRALIEQSFARARSVTR